MDIMSVAGEGSEENGEHLIEKWRKGDPCNKMTESLTEMCPAVMWKAEFVSDKIGNLAEETSKQC